MYPAIALFALLTSLMLFLISTRQFPVILRLFVWIAGVVCLAIAGWLFLDYPLLHFLANAPTLPPELILRTALENWSVVAHAWTQAGLALFVPVTVLAVATLVALGPGDSVERTVRPLMFGLLCAISGVVFALSIAAVGLGGSFERRVYVGIPTERDIIDGDTFVIGEATLRLAGIDAPEDDQLCMVGPNLTMPCDYGSGAWLSNLIVRNPVFCLREGEQLDGVRGPPPEESFGRPLVTCWVKTLGAEFVDVSKTLLAHGRVDVYRSSDDVRSTYEFVGCTLTPRAWRRWRHADYDSRTALAAALVQKIIRADESQVLGDCSILRGP